MNVEAVTHGYLFIPILKPPLPDALVMIIERKFGENIRTLDLVLKCFQEELIAKEACFSYKRCYLCLRGGHICKICKFVTPEFFLILEVREVLSRKM